VKTSCFCVRSDGNCKECRGDQYWFWTPGWQEGEREVDKYVLEGNIQEYDTIEEFIRTLKVTSPQ